MITIVNKPTRKMPTFKELKIGDTFIKDGNLYIVTEEVIDHNDLGSNAIMLDKAILRWFDEDEEVEPVDMEITIFWKSTSKQGGKQQ